jgi:ferredoxin
VSKFKILTEEKNCEGCFFCVLNCSSRFNEGFNPAKAAIRIVTHLDKDNEILFLEKCDSCGICARHCPCDALRLEMVGEN